MLISKVLKLKQSQYELDFVDIDLATDTPLFLDPVAFHTSKGSFAKSCSDDITGFFEAVLHAAMTGNADLGVNLLSALREPNETQLGLSTGLPRGHGLGEGQARIIFKRIRGSKAAQSGLLEDLNDVSMFVRGIGPDKVSDMTTNIIRKHLVKYTQEQFDILGIPIEGESPTGLLWNSADAAWEDGYDFIPIVNDRKILLVPKRFVRWRRDFGGSGRRYYDRYIVAHIREEQLTSGGSLVKLIKRKSGRTDRVVRREDILKKTPNTKESIAQFSDNNPGVYKKFKDSFFKHSAVPNRVLHDLQPNTDSETKVIANLVQTLRALPPGQRHAGDYESLITGIAHILFYPDISNPVIHRPINDRRKIIDISFDNTADVGFFARMLEDPFCQSREIMIECKNYSHDVSNPELDQLLTRFDDRRGRFGILACRSISNVALSTKRATDGFTAKQGVVLLFTDDDLITALEAPELQRHVFIQDMLNKKFRALRG